MGPTQGPALLIQAMNFIILMESFTNIITMHSQICMEKEKELKLLQYMAILALHLGSITDIGAVNFNILVEGFMDIMAMHLVFLKNIYW